uniref:Retrotransposon gag domain-containing protein n=1 Tax=Mycena chlorophos TaxID=658473 RepID=A0ABQ0LY17_MYCCL|nr:predicted protein [Mycena chlorophos]
MHCSSLPFHVLCPTSSSEDVVIFLHSKLPTFPPLTAKPSPSTISSWVKCISDQLKLYKHFNLDFQLDADTIIIMAGLMLEQKDAAQWWDNNGDELVKLKSFDDFVANFCDAFLSAN